jgi:hypothetical protein
MKKIRNICTKLRIGFDPSKPEKQSCRLVLHPRFGPVCRRNALWVALRHEGGEMYFPKRDSAAALCGCAGTRPARVCAVRKIAEQDSADAQSVTLRRVSCIAAAPWRMQGLRSSTTSQLRFGARFSVFLFDNLMQEMLLGAMSNSPSR